MKIQKSIVQKRSPALRANAENDQLNSSLRILLVDDEIDLLMIIHNFLKLQNINSSTASSMKEALDYLDNSKKQNELPDIIITDLHLESGTGLDIANATYDINKDIKIILMSGKSQIEVEKIKQHVNIVHFLQKPFSLNELLTALHHI